MNTTVGYAYGVELLTLCQVFYSFAVIQTRFVVFVLHLLAGAGAVPFSIDSRNAGVQQQYSFMAETKFPPHRTTTRTSQSFYFTLQATRVPTSVPLRPISAGVFKSSLPLLAAQISTVYLLRCSALAATPVVEVRSTATGSEPVAAGCAM